MLKLTYFDETWRGEPARLIMAAAGAKFEDERLQESEWPARKPSLLWGALPVLQEGDKVLAQSKAIYRYLGHKYKMAGSDPWESAKCDELVDAVNDVGDVFIDIVWLEKDEKKKAEKKTKFETETLPTLLSRMNKVQVANGGDWLVGKSMTWADIVVVESIRLLTEGHPKMIDGYPQLKKVYDAVFANKGISEFRAKHKK